MKKKTYILMIEDDDTIILKLTEQEAKIIKWFIYNPLAGYNMGLQELNDDDTYEVE